jgi:rRNA-processing protein FCF1
MKEVILDTNFILTCVKQKIDFFEEIKLMGLKIIIPKPVIKEIELLAKYDKKYHSQEDAKLALKILEKGKFEKRNLDEGTVDAGIIKAAKADNKMIVATLDKRIKSLIINPKLVIKDMKTLKID